MLFRSSGRVSKKGIVFQSLRHTMATLLARAQMHPSVAQKILRHANLETTLAIYRHVDEIEEMRSAVAKLDFGPVEEQAPFKTISKVPSTDDSEWMPPPARTTGFRCRCLRDIW